MRKSTKTDRAGTTERQNAEDESTRRTTRGNQSPLRNGAGRIRNAPGRNPETPGGRDRGRLKDIAIRGGLAAGRVPDRNDRNQSRGICRRRIVKARDRVNRDRDLGTSVRALGVLTGARNGLVQDADRVLAVAGRITTADPVPPAAVGVRGRTDIEMPRNVQVVFFYCFCTSVRFFLY